MSCSQFDEFFDGQLEPTAASAFRVHLATCDRCQAALRGRMQEALVVDELAPMATVSPIRRVRYTAIGVAIALAAAAALVWTLRGSTPATPVPPRVATLDVKIEKGPTIKRGDSAHVGDFVHATAHGPLWIYRGDHELVLACPGGAGCRADGADFEIKAMGTYQLVALAPTTIVPRGDYDTDVAAAATAQVKYTVKTIDVQ